MANIPRDFNSNSTPAYQVHHPANLPEHFEAHFDEKLGKYYYFNRLTNESTWDPPTGPPAAPLAHNQHPYQHNQHHNGNDPYNHDGTNPNGAGGTNNLPHNPYLHSSVVASAPVGYPAAAPNHTHDPSPHQPAGYPPAHPSSASLDYPPASTAYPPANASPPHAPAAAAPAPGPLYPPSSGALYRPPQANANAAYPMAHQPPDPAAYPPPQHHAQAHGQGQGQGQGYAQPPPGSAGPHHQNQNPAPSAPLPYTAPGSLYPQNAPAQGQPDSSQDIYASAPPYSPIHGPRPPAHGAYPPVPGHQAAAPPNRPNQHYPQQHSPPGQGPSPSPGAPPHYGHDAQQPPPHHAQSSYPYGQQQQQQQQQQQHPQHSPEPYPPAGGPATQHSYHHGGAGPPHQQSYGAHHHPIQSYPPQQSHLYQQPSQQHQHHGSLSQDPYATNASQGHQQHAPPSHQMIQSQQSNPSYSSAYPASGGGALSFQPFSRPLGSTAYSSSPTSVAAFAPGAPVNISLELRAINLKKKDLLSKSDPICLLLTPEDPLTITAGSRWITRAQTEVIRNTSTPVWTTRLRVPYQFEQYQPLRFLLLDVDDFKKQRGDTIGYADTTLAHIVRNVNETLPIQAPPRKEKRGPGVMIGPPFRPGSTMDQSKFVGHLIVRSHDEDSAGCIKLDLGLRGSNIPSLDKVAGFTTSKADPFYKLNLLLPNNPHPVALYTSEHYDNNSEPSWRAKRITIPATDQPDEKLQFKVDVYDWNRNRQHGLIGSSQFTLADTLKKIQAFEIVRPNKAPVGATGRSSKRVPLLHVREAVAKRKPSFVSYLGGGLRLNFMVAIDFTRSNRPSAQRDSLHYLGEHPGAFLQTSQYAQALRAVSSVMDPYIGDDGPITALGFGARVPWAGPHEQDKKEFHIGGAIHGDNSEASREVYGTEKLMNAYRACAEQVEMSGPTMFAPVIRTAVQLANMAPMSHAAQVFSVLLIMTDGVLDDMQMTIDEIVKASYSTPIAIVIVGVGNADFTKMKQLDSDDVKLKSQTSGNEAKHDIVQFCKFSSGMSVQQLAAEVLQEVPSRVVEFMVDKGLQPMHGGDAVAPQGGQQQHPASMGYKSQC